MSAKYLILGGNGLLGYSMTKALSDKGETVRVADYNNPNDIERLSNVEYCFGDIRDGEFLSILLKNVDVVMDFVSTTMPNSIDTSLRNEINNTLSYHDYVLSMMAKNGVFQYVFPSSGGAVYGNKKEGQAKETDTPHPTTPYGVGKLMTEKLIQYYSDRCGIKGYVFRIGNLYGSPIYRKKTQGIIDVFIQNVLRGEEITLWKSANEAIRDYIYIDDAIDAIIETVKKESEREEVRLYNVGTGVGTSTKDIMSMIFEITKRSGAITICEEISSGLDRIVLSTDKINEEIGWKYKTTIREGIKRTVELKKILLEKN